MDPLSTSTFWRRLDERIDRRAQRMARIVRGLVVAANGTGLRLAGTVAARAAELLHDTEIAQHYGLASVPPAGTEVIAVPVGGASSHRVVVAELDPSTRPTDLLPGEAAVYTSAGNQVRVCVDGSVEIRTPTSVAVQVTPAGQVLLAGGGAPVARVGDAVEVVATDSLGGPVTITSATIIGGSTLVQAGG